MNDVSSNGMETELEQVRGALAAWRATPGRRHKIPDAVWRKAVRAAKRYGLNPVSRALGLDYNCLKKHVAGTGRSENRSIVPSPAFVEIKPVAPLEDLACVIELVKGGGARMRICVKSAGSVDWCRIKEAFLGA
jgi:hypothetical protein